MRSNYKTLFLLTLIMFLIQNSNFAQSGINIGIAPIGLIDKLAISTELQGKKIVVLGLRFPTTILMYGLVIKPK